MREPFREIEKPKGTGRAEEEAVFDTRSRIVVLGIWCSCSGSLCGSPSVIVDVRAVKLAETSEEDNEVLFVVVEAEVVSGSSVESATEFGDEVFSRSFACCSCSRRCSKPYSFSRATSVLITRLALASSMERFLSISQF